MNTVVESKSFSKKELIKKGWERTKEHARLLLKILLVFILLSLVSSIVNVTMEGSAIALLVNIASTIIQTVFEIGFITIGLEIVDGKKPGFKDLYSHYPLFLPFFLTSLIFWIMVLVGLILLIVPGIYLAVKYQFTSFVVVDKKLSYWTAIKKAGELTQGRWMKIFLFDLTLIGLNILGLLALGVGLLLTIPTSFFAAAYLYRKLS